MMSAVALVAIYVLSGCVLTPPYAAIPHDGAAGGPTGALNSTIALMAGQAAAEGDYTIGPEDLLEVTLFDIEDKAGEPRLIPARVSNTGYITLPYVGKVFAEGRTPEAFEAELRESFLRFIHQPQITVFVREYRSYRVSVVGYVNKAGVLELRGRKTLLEAIAMAGGLNEEAGRSVRVTRELVGQIQTVLIDLERLARDGDMRLNLTLLAGDVINVPRAGIFYVEGRVKEPGAYPLLQKTTVTQALATAGGPEVTMAKLGGIILYRKTRDGQRKAVPVRLASIRAGKAEDFDIEEDDIVFVPLAGGKFFIDKLMGLFHIGFSEPL